MSYTLMHGPTLRQGAPYTFFLPHPWLVGAVRVGDLVKLGFDYDPPGENYGGERMWVEVESIDGVTYVGRLTNDPEETILKCGDEVTFNRDHVLDVILVDKDRLPEYHSDLGRMPAIPDHREYWERCLVDECVLYDGVPVEYVYREEPDMDEPEDKYPDSGWRIRGRAGDATDEELDDRKPAYVALGAVLNRDDSWLDLIDAPIGSAFMRDFDANRYEPVEFSSSSD